MGDDDVDGTPPGHEGDGPGGFAPPAKHVAADRAAVRSLRAAQRIGEVLAEGGTTEEPVTIDRRGPQRSIAALDRMLAAALAEDERAEDTPP